MLHRLFIAAFVWIALALPGLASQTGVVLIVANGQYDRLPRAAGADTVLMTARRFGSAGFDADQATDLSAAAMRAALDSVAERIGRESPHRVVLVFSGYTLHSDQGAWLMGTEAVNPSLFNVDAMGVRLETLLAIAAQVQGGAVVAIADLGFPLRPGTGLQPGLPQSVSVPQGVSLVRGPAAQVQTVLDALARPGTNLGQAVAMTRQGRLEGFNPPHLTFLPPDHAPVQDADRAAWAEAEAENSAAAYRAYLDLFPAGLFAADARAAIDRLENTPDRIEAALGLTRDERRAIQRDLTLLGYDPRGIDGVFGSGTRAAIRAWQGANRFSPTGFVTRDQVFELAQQGARRAAQLEAEARARQAEEERRDRAYWRDTGSGQDEAGLRAYLQRYPQGIFAAIARQRLDQIEADRRAAEEATERAFWEATRRADTEAAYLDYLSRYPEGPNAEAARDRLEELRNPPLTRREIDEARRAEEALILPDFTVMLIERRLTRLGYQPGPIDGRIDRQTRRAIRAFQRDHGLPATGYLTQQMVLDLTAGGLLDILR